MSEAIQGPYHVNKRYPFWVDGPDGRRVVDMETGVWSVEQLKATARLLAASWGLDRQLRVAIAWIEQLNSYDNPDPSAPSQEELLEQLRAALDPTPARVGEGG